MEPTHTARIIPLRRTARQTPEWQALGETQRQALIEKRMAFLQGKGRPARATEWMMQHVEELDAMAFSFLPGTEGISWRELCMEGHKAMQQPSLEPAFTARYGAMLEAHKRLLTAVYDIADERLKQERRGR